MLFKETYRIKFTVTKEYQFHGIVSDIVYSLFDINYEIYESKEDVFPIWILIHFHQTDCYMYEVIEFFRSTSDSFFMVKHKIRSLQKFWKLPFPVWRRFFRRKDSFPIFLRSDIHFFMLLFIEHSGLALIHLIVICLLFFNRRYQLP